MIAAESAEQLDQFRPRTDLHVQLEELLERELLRLDAAGLRKVRFGNSICQTSASVGSIGELCANRAHLSTSVVIFSRHEST